MNFDQSQHRKQLRSILDFIASSALKNEDAAATECTPVCATHNFLKVQHDTTSAEDEDEDEAQSPFAFYNLNVSGRHQQSIWSSVLPSKKCHNGEKACWLKLSRVANSNGLQQLPSPSRAVRRFFENCFE